MIRARVRFKVTNTSRSTILRSPLSLAFVSLWCCVSLKVIDGLQFTQSGNIVVSSYIDAFIRSPLFTEEECFMSIIAMLLLTLIFQSP